MKFFKMMFPKPNWNYRQDCGRTVGGSRPILLWLLQLICDRNLWNWMKLEWVWNSFRIFFWAGLGFFWDFLAGTICLVFATVWNLNLSFCMVFATFGHVHLPFCMGFTTCGHVHLPFCMVFATFWHVHLPFCMGFPTCGHVHLPFCMVFATFWHVHLPFCMGCSTCEHVHPNIYRCGSLGLDKKRVGGIEGGR